MSARDVIASELARISRVDMDEAPRYARASVRTAALHVERALTAAGYRIEECEKFEDSNAVHINMLRGAIAKPSIDQIAHIYPNIGAVLSAASALVEALALYGFPVSDAAEPALRDGGSREAKALHHAAKDFAAAIRSIGRKA